MSPVACLVCMRLKDMTRVHPRQVEKQCSLCKETVGVYPSGQSVLATYPDTPIVCHVCNEDGGLQILAPGALLEPFESKLREP